MEFENVFGVIHRMLFQDVKDLLTLGGSSTIRRTDPPVPRSRLIQKALLSRVFVLVAMAVSCAVFPNHNPGDDVFQFSLVPEEPCFCLKGQACEQWIHGTSPSTNSTVCADVEQLAPPNAWIDKTYRFLLTPLTRWDASRFLQLAVYPSTRDPTPVRLVDHPECETNPHACDDLFLPSEQAHAFFPLLPTILRTLAGILLHVFPRRFLPSTYSTVVVLVALLWNTFCFVVAALALYELTLAILPHHLSSSWPAQKDRKLPRHYGPRLADRVFLLFCVHPASLFCTTAYSEATFGMFHFVGHALFAKLSVWAAIPFWMAASGTRSNGTINAVWLVLQGLGMASSSLQKRQPTQALWGLFLCLVLSLAVVYPVYWHDTTGYNRHCGWGEEEGLVRPSWCDRSSFSLYAYVQRKHWNVGIFRYYTWKKIPNFLLATPIWVLSIMAVVDWIQASFKRYHNGKDGSIPNLVNWAMVSLAAFHGGNSQQDNPALLSEECVFLGPLMLGHYAVLAAVCLVGMLVAHVEINTRMICSSCPAIYWYMALCIGTVKETSKKASLAGMARYTLKALILPYCLLYNFLGIIMHPNWLPWT